MFCYKSNILFWAKYFIIRTKRGNICQLIILAKEVAKNFQNIICNFITKCWIIKMTFQAINLPWSWKSKIYLKKKGRIRVLNWHRTLNIKIWKTFNSTFQSAHSRFSLNEEKFSSINLIERKCIMPIGTRWARYPSIAE